jgi:Tol biopolymer transport system component
MKVDPNWNALPASTPWALRSLLRRCLQKDPKRRLQTITDAKFEIEEIVNEPVSETPVSASIPNRPDRRFRFALAGLALALLTAATLAVIHWREAPPDIRETRFAISPGETVGPLDAFSLAVSPDGRRVAFTGIAGTLWVRPLDSLEAVQLAGTERGFAPFWSPDSRSIGFFDGGKLKRVAIGGGPPQIVCDAATLATSRGTWNADGTILFGSGPVLYRVSAAGGQPAKLTELDQSRQETNHSNPFFLPDGRHFLFLARSSMPGNSSIRVGSLDSAETREVIKAVSEAAYAPPGWLLFQRDGTLFAQSFDAGRYELAGEPVRVAEGIVNSFAGLAAFSVSNTGVLVYRTGGGVAERELAWFERSGRRLDTIGSRAGYTNLELSPDQTRLAVDITDPRLGTRDIWLMELARPVTTRLTFNTEGDQRPVWSPDGKTVVFQLGRAGQGDEITAKLSSGIGSQETWLKTDGVAVPYSFSPDGRFLLMLRARTQGATGNLWILPLEGDRKPYVVIKSPYWDTPGISVPGGSGENHGQFSPDGKWIVYASNESGRNEIYVESFPPGAGRWQISTTGGLQPRWRRDGREIFYVATDGKLMAAAVQGGGAFQAQTPVALFQTPLNGLTFAPGGSRQYEVSADGQRFLVNMPVSLTASTPITVVLNWAAALKK